MTTASTTAETDEAQFAREWEQWHREHEARRAAPLGFLAITGLYWLSAEPQSLVSAPGRWSADADGAVVELGEAERLTLDGTPLRGRHAFGILPERGGVTLEFTDGGVRGAVEVAQRGGHTIVRPRRADHPFLAAYEGTPAYPASPRWRVAARYRPFDEPRPTRVGSAVEGLEHVYDAPGAVEFELHGEPFALTVFPGGADGSLLALFTDATSGVTTYAANRALIVPAPDAAGDTVLDFNRATNLPCAYTDHATCPLPPAENRLPVAVEAGEQTPLSRVHAAVPASAPA